MEIDVLKKLDEIYELQEKTMQQKSAQHSDTMREIAVIKEKLSKVEVQTTKTNGRVNSLENWRELLIGGGAIMVLIVLPLISYIFITEIKTVQREINLLQK